MKTATYSGGASVRIIESGEIGMLIDNSPTNCVVQVQNAYGDHVLMNFRPHEIESASLKMATQDPLIRAAKKVYRESTQYQLDQLLEEETRWKRKATIAENKLASVRRRINELAKELVKVKEGK